MLYSRVLRFGLCSNSVWRPRNMQENSSRLQGAVAYSCSHREKRSLCVRLQFIMYMRRPKVESAHSMEK